MKKATNTILIAGIVLITLAVIAVIFTSTSEIKHVRNTTDLVDHTHDVLFQTEKILELTMVNITASHSFALTGSEEFIQEINVSRNNLNQELLALRFKLADNALQLQQLDSLNSLIKNRLAFTDEVVGIRRNTNIEQAITHINSGRGRLYTHGIRTIIRQMQQEERRLLNIRRDANEEAIRQLDVFLISILAIVLFILMLLIAKLRSDVLREKKVNEQNQYLATLLTQVPDAIISTDKDLVIQSWNKGAEELYGWKAEEVINKPTKEVLSTTFVDLTREEVLTSFNETGQWSGEVIHQRKSGEPVEVFAASARLKNKAGNDAGIVNVVRDITESKRIQKKLEQFNEELSKQVAEQTAEIKNAYDSLKRSQEKYHTLVEHASDGIFVADAKGRYTNVNSRGCEMTGYSKEELLQLGIGDLLSKKEIVQKPLQLDVLRSGKSLLTERTLQKKDGSPLPVEISSRMLNDGRFLAIVRDISQRKSIETKLEESEAKFKHLVEQSLVGVYIVQDQKFVYVNPQMAKMHGYTEKELLAMHSITELVDESDREMVSQNLLSRLKGDIQSINYEFAVRRKDRQRVYMEVFGSRTTFMGKPAIIGSAIDVTERKKAVEEIKNSEEFRRLIMNSSMDAIICMDLSGNITFWNKQADKIFGWKEHQVLGKSLAEVVIPHKFRPLHQNGLLRYLKTAEGPVFNRLIELNALHANGREFPVEVFIIPIRQHGSEFFCGFLRDITERKKVEEELSKERNLLRTLIDNLPDYIYVKDTEFRHLINNRANVALIGAQTEQETLGKSVMDYFPSEIAREYIEDDKKVIESKMPVINREELVVTETGEERWLLTTKVPLIAKNDEPIGLVGISRDITERKKIEAILIESEEKYRNLFANNPMNLWVIDTQTNRIIDVNEAAINQYGYQREEFLGLHLMDLRPPEDIDRLQEHVDLKRSTGPYRKAGIWRHRRKDGSVMLMDITAHDILYENEKAVLVLAIDVTEKVHAEQKILETSEQLRQLSAHLQQVREEERLNMAREIHDELGQLLTVLKMDVSWLNKKLVTDEEPIRQKVKDILTMLDKTVRTVRRIATELRPSVLDDLGLIAAMEWQAEEFRQRSGIDVELRLRGDLQIPSSMNISLFRIFQESLTNIARHANASRVVVNLAQQSDQLVLSVTDDGKGFNNSDIEQKKTLGLLGMKERALMIGGKYEIASVAGEGTQVTLTVPLHINQQTVIENKL